MSRLKWTTVLALTTLLSNHSARAQDIPVTIAGAGGSVQEGQRIATWAPAASKLGYTLKEASADEGLNAVKLQVEAKAVTYDIVQMGAYEGAIGGAQGVLEPIDYSVVDASAFVPGTAGKYCVGYITIAFTFAVNTRTFGDKGPNTWTDFWDVAKFPGKRAMRANAEAQLEAALLADGVAPPDLYKVLETPAGLDRAIKKIEALKPHIAVWWKSGAEHAQLMKDGAVDMTTGWNARFAAAVKDGARATYGFNQAVLGSDCYAVPKGAPHRIAAMRMLNEIVSAEAQARLTKYVLYGPTNTKAFETGLIAPDIAALLPTNPQNAALGVVQNTDWWVKNNTRAQEAFDNMMSR